MRDLNRLIYNTIRLDPQYITLTGATTQDPRIYKLYTPAHIEVSEEKPAYSVYGIMGSSKPPVWVLTAQRNNYAYRLEVFSVIDTLLTEVCERLEEIFRDKHFQTTTYVVGYTYAVRGVVAFEEARRLYTETMTVYLENIYAK
jgi:hypothetical protein